VDLEVREAEKRGWKERMGRRAEKRGIVLRAEGVYRPGGSVGME